VKGATKTVAERKGLKDLAPITASYLLVSGIPCFVDPVGKRWTDSLWHKDLVQHVRYLANLTLAAPRREAAPPSGAACLTDDPRFKHVSYVDLPASDSYLEGIGRWPRMFRTLWQAVGRARLVHAGVADWPIPTGWAATLAAKMRRRTLLINVESAFWRVPRNAPAAKRLQSWAWERVNRWCVRQADLPLFTQHEFARQMLRDPSRAYVFQASWVDEDKVLDRHTAERCWETKASQEPASFLFAGRLIPEKGILDLLRAVADTKVPIRLDIIGSGELADAVKQAASADDRIRLLPPVPYDHSFFELVRRYHALVVPSRTDEQPRIVYDAYSQAVPVLATRTAGNAECVTDGETGWLAPPGNTKALSDLLEQSQSNHAALREMGLRALQIARGYTHEEMHRRRWELLSRLI
jgi:glycosyltransferase involved in cell wall biosynthesis